MLRFAAIVCAFIATGLFAWSGYLVYRAPGASDSTRIDGDSELQETNGLSVENAQQDLGERLVGEHSVVFRITNHSNRQASVIGYPVACGLRCCLERKNEGRMPVPPGATLEVLVVLDVVESGPFKFEGNLFLDDGGQLRTVRVKLTGVGVQPEGKPHATPP